MRYLIQKIAILLSSLGLFAIPVFASASCTIQGSSVVYINGIFTPLSKAKTELAHLRGIYREKTGDTSVTFINGYNQTHLAGLGDQIESVSQIFGSPISTYDRDTILTEIYPQVATRKLLLVGHSQGALYANELYNYLISHGEPIESIGEYVVAIPADRIADKNGKYLNSSGDSILATLRSGGIPILPNNIDLGVSGQNNGGFWQGHSFKDVYLAQASDRILSDIQTQLSELKAVYPSDSGCFTPPDPTVSYRAQKVLFAAGDFVAPKIVLGANAVVIALNTVSDIGLAAVSGAVDLAQQVASDLAVYAGGVDGLAHSAEPKYQPTNLNLVQYIYGSEKQTVDGESLHDLINGNASQGGAVVLATVDDAEEGAPQVTQPPTEPEAPTVPIGPAPGFSPGGGGSGQPIVIVSDAPAAQETVSLIQNTEVETDEASTTNATSSEAVVPVEPPPAAVPVVINEVAWGGGFGSPDDQWVELYNNGSDSVSLDDIVLTSADGSLYMPLSGTIAGNGFYILLANDEAIRNIKNNWGNYFASASLVLGLSPKQLQLVRVGSGGTTTLDQTPAADTCGGAWCAGSAGATDGYAAPTGNAFPITMERVSVGVSGEDASNWASSDGYTYNANDRNQQRIIGTPNRANSSHWPMVGFVCTGDSEVLAPGSSYAHRPASNSCHYLSGYSNYSWSPEALLLKGVVGSSTIVTKLSAGSGPNKDLQTNASNNYDFASAQSGDMYTIVFFEFNNNVGGSYNAYYLGDMEKYMQTGFRNDGVTDTAPYSYQTIELVIP